MSEEKILTKEECLKRGGHNWNYHQDGDNVNKFGVRIPDVHYGSSAFNWINPSQYRTCRFCCCRQELVPKKWIEINNKELKQIELGLQLVKI